MKTFLDKLVLTIIIIVVIIAGIWDLVGLSSEGVFGLDAQASQKGTAKVIKEQQMDPTTLTRLPNL
jgi:L-cystine uptake protein TcyP (sodium:dicarboxylate symporter family)